MNSASVQIAVGKRLTIVDSVGQNGADGQSLRGQNVNDYPDGALFYVRNSNRFYKLKKNQAIAIAEDTSNMDNVINGIGSNATDGRFVAVVQMAVITLTNGVGSQNGFDVNPGGWFHISYVTFGASPGFLRAEVTSDTTVTAHSTDGESSGGTVFVTYYETSEGE